LSDDLRTALASAQFDDRRLLQFRRSRHTSGSANNAPP
jgi:hypothetical protein